LVDLDFNIRLVGHINVTGVRLSSSVQEEHLFQRLAPGYRTRCLE